MEAAHPEIDESTLPELDDTDHPENAKRMLRAAVHLFARQGYKGTSVREIVQAAQVTNPMLYYYFDDKQGLFDTLMNFLFDVLTGDVADAVGEASDLEQTVELIVIGYFGACRRSPIAVKFVYTVVFGPTEGTPRFDIFAAREQLFRGISRQFERAIESDELPADGFEPDFLAEQLLGLISNHLMRALKKAENAEDFNQKLRSHLTDEVAEDLRSFFFRGARCADG